LVVEISDSQLDVEQGNAKEKTEKKDYMLSISILNVASTVEVSLFHQLLRV